MEDRGVRGGEEEGEEREGGGRRREGSRENDIRRIKAKEDILKRLNIVNRFNVVKINGSKVRKYGAA